MDSFYENIGGKLKGWAKFIFVAEAIGAIIGGINLLGNDAVVAGLLLLFFGPIAALISTWLLYAFGELVEKTAANEENTRAILKKLEATNPAPKAPKPVSKPTAPQTHAWRCTNCNSMTTTTPCEHCGYTEQSAPFRCGKCGHEGPYAGPCPDCGSSIRIYN